MQTRVLIIGGGITGAGIARDLALRGVHCTIVEKMDINAGASGANHGLLHSGARYVSSDMALAEECWREGRHLKRLASHCIENTGGFFVAVQGDDEKYVADFPHLCAQSRIPVQTVDIKEARDMEPALSDHVIAVYQVEDASIDPFKLSMENISQACELGCTLLRHVEVIDFVKDRNRIRAARMRNNLTGKTFLLEAEQIINATGAWAGSIAKMAGVHVHIVFSKGSLLVTHNRITERVINRLRPSSNADILVPGGTVSILGTTSVRIDDLEDIRPTVYEMDVIVGEGAKMLPVLEKTRYIRAYAGVRPLFGSSSSENDRGIRRAIALIDHEDQGLSNFVTITGGKLTTYRLMAEKTADLVCRRLGVTAPCLTKTTPLPLTHAAQWTEPGLAPRIWLHHHEPENVLVCECEMVPKSTVDCIIDAIHKQGGQPDLMAIGIRSRIGKGACQGTVCGMRLLAYLYGKGELNDHQGLTSLKEFLRERWRGVRPLLWGMPLIQAEMQEAFYCGLCGLELYSDNAEAK